MTKTYQRGDLRALLGMNIQSGKSFGNGDFVRYVFRRDGLWLQMKSKAKRLATADELEALIGLSDPEPKQGKSGLYGLPGQRPLLPFPFTVRQLMEFDETAGGVVYERCERGTFTGEWVAELAQATGQKDEAHAKRNAAELARYVMGWEDVPEDGETAQQPNQPAEVLDPLLQPPVDTEIPRAVSRTQAQDATVIAAIRNLGHDPKALPAWQYGSPGVKAAVKKAIEGNPLFVGTTVFEKAWERLRSRGEIAEAKPSH